MGVFQKQMYVLVLFKTLGTDIDGESALQFAAATGSTVSLQNLSITSLQADYRSFLESGESACWEVR